MNALIIGMGSMGKRRAHLLHSIDESIRIIGVDLQESRRKNAEEELGIITRSSIKDACTEFNPEIALISTSPLSHAEIIKECLLNKIHVFTELNLVDNGYEENIKLAEDKGLVLFLSSTFLYRKEVQFIKKSIKECACKVYYMYHVGQYLPDWHPWENYKSFFVGDKRTNGCRECMAIEFPWLIDTFGDVKSITSFSSKYSNLEIDFPDTYQIMIEHETGHRGLITVDIVSRKAVRRLEISGENIYLTWGGTPDSLNMYNYIEKKDTSIKMYDSVEMREGYSAFIIENAYKSEIENFLNVIRKTEQARYSFQKDCEILSLIDSIENF